jgi:hypothetical protein
MASIFLSYRRSDTSGHAGRLADALEARYGPDAVFRDVESIEAGALFDEAIERALADCRVFVPLIGDEWLSGAGSDGRRRLDDPADFVRREVAAALRRGIPVIPVLLEGATMPPGSALPPDLQSLARYQGLELSETRWDYDVQRLVEAIDRGLGLLPASAQPAHAEARRAPAAPIGISRRASVAGGLAVLGLAAGTTAWWRSRSRESPASVATALATVPAVDGVWMLPSGSFWTVRQDGRRLVVEETHYDSRQMWRRGTGAVLDDGTIEIELLPVFDPPERLRLSYRLRLSSDARNLSGEVRDLVSGRSETVTLLRR